MIRTEILPNIAEGNGRWNKALDKHRVESKIERKIYGRKAPLGSGFEMNSERICLNSPLDSVRVHRDMKVGRTKSSYGVGSKFDPRKSLHCPQKVDSR